MRVWQDSPGDLQGVRGAAPRGSSSPRGSLWEWLWRQVETGARQAKAGANDMKRTGYNMTSESVSKR